MVQFIDVNPDDIPNFRLGSRGRVSYPILKSFLERGSKVSQLDRSDYEQPVQALRQSLMGYIKQHKLPVHIFMRSGELYLVRTDIDEETGEISTDNNDIEKVLNAKRKPVVVGGKPMSLDAALEEQE
jgi:hypothetical protein